MIVFHGVRKPNRVIPPPRSPLCVRRMDPAPGHTCQVTSDVTGGKLERLHVDKVSDCFGDVAAVATGTSAFISITSVDPFIGIVSVEDDAPGIRARSAAERLSPQCVEE